MGTKTWHCFQRGGAVVCSIQTVIYYSFCFVALILCGCGRMRSSRGFKLYQKGMNAIMMSHDPQGAISYFKKALNCSLDLSLRADVLNNYACACAATSQYVVAKKQWYALLKNKYYKTPEVACVNLGKLFLLEKNLDEADIFFHQALTYAPDYVDALFCIAFLAWQRSDYDKARTFVNVVLTRSPYHDLAYKLRLLI